MKKYLALVLAALLLAFTASAQMKRGGQKKEPPKTEKTTKKQNGSSGNSGKKRKSESTSKSQSSSSSQSNSTPESQSPVTVTRPAEPTAYDVTFSCNVNDAVMFIDGNDYGKPSGTRTLKTGKHQVKVVSEGFEDYVATINVAAGSNSFDFKMTRQGPSEAYVPKIETITVKGVSFDMVFVEGGTFLMGATEEQGSDAESDEKPVHKVTLSDYYIGKYEVTQELWQAVMGKKPSHFKNKPQNPVESVSWDDCQKFLEKLNKLTGRNFRLPTEAEWEYAARGGKWSRGYKYAGSDQIDAVAWYESNSAGMTHPVGQKAPNELGLYDMSGNVWEWCQDWYGGYSSESQTNPQGPSGSSRVHRGGGWYYDARRCRVSGRNYWYSDFQVDDRGLRLAL